MIDSCLCVYIYIQTNTLEPCTHTHTHTHSTFVREPLLDTHKWRNNFPKNTSKLTVSTPDEIFWWLTRFLMAHDVKYVYVSCVCVLLDTHNWRDKAPPKHVQTHREYARWDVRVNHTLLDTHTSEETSLPKTRPNSPRVRQMRCPSVPQKTGRVSRGCWLCAADLV